MNILNDLYGYLSVFPGEAMKLVALHDQLREEPELILRRDNMRGHVTTSMMVVNEAKTHGLVIDHLVLRLWLQPGGHYESTGSLVESALREVYEETGVDDIEVISAALEGVIPLDIDTHAIPARPEKNEGAHYHHDFVYLGVARGDPVLTRQVEEVAGVKWVPLTELQQSHSRMSRLASKAIDQLGETA